MARSSEAKPWKEHTSRGEDHAKLPLAELSMCRLQQWVVCVAQGKRYALPNTRIMVHHPSGAARGQATDIHNEARELKRFAQLLQQGPVRCNKQDC